MKLNIIICSLLGISVIGDARGALTPEGLGEIMGGIMFGAMQTNDQKDYMTCAESEGIKAIPYIEKAVEMIQSKDENDTTLGVQMLQVHTKKLLNIIYSCSDSDDLSDIKKLQYMIQIITKEKEFLAYIPETDDDMEMLTFDSLRLVTEVNEALKHYSDENYSLFGVSVGDMFRRMYQKTDNMAIVSRMEMEVIEDKFEQNLLKNFQSVIVGFIQGMFRLDKAPQIQTCLGDVQKGWNDLKEGITNMERQTPQSTLESLKNIASMIKDIVGQLSECEGLRQTIISLVALSATLSNPQAFIFHIGSQIIVNGADIFQGIQNSIESWQSQSFYQFGQELGIALSQIFITEGNPFDLDDQEIENIDISDIEALFERFENQLEM